MLFHKSLALLSLENLKEGWLLYESRKKLIHTKNGNLRHQKKSGIKIKI